MRMILDFFFLSLLGCLKQMQREATDYFVHERIHGELRNHIHTFSGFLSIARLEDSRSRETFNPLECLFRFLPFLLTACETRQRARSDHSEVILPPSVMIRHQGRPVCYIHQVMLILGHIVSDSTWGHRGFRVFQLQTPSPRRPDRE